MSTRSKTHVIDTKAIKAVVNALPDHWVVRELTERDYGIDLMVEIFLPGGNDKRGLQTYDASGGLFHIQIKGTEKALPLKAGKFIYSLKKSSLKYIEKFNVPFFLFRVDVSSGPAKIYAIWLQRYISDELDMKNPGWREVKKPRTVPIEIPASNTLDNDLLDRIEAIALHPKYIEELVEFRELFFEVDHKIAAMAHGTHSVDLDSIRRVRNLLYRMTRLNVLLTSNGCCIDRPCVAEVIQYLDGLKLESGPSHTVVSLPHGDNFKLLYESIDGIKSVENFLSEEDGQSSY
jgi:Domain of unknown function (DUF4365)